MVSKLYFFHKRKRVVQGIGSVVIPKGKWEGKGYYYNRGHGKTATGWTKYSPAKDSKRGRGIGKGSMKHTHDKSK